MPPLPDQIQQRPGHPRLDEDIDYITILVYRAPEVLAFTLYLYEDLVQVPCVTETTPSCAKTRPF